jgi:hypothetical protein
MTLEEILKLINATESLTTTIFPDLLALAKLFLTSDKSMTVGELQALAQTNFDSNKKYYEEWMKAHPEV